MNEQLKSGSVEENEFKLKTLKLTNQ